MLQIISYQSRSQIAGIFSQFNPQAQSWVVSDLRTKFEIQRKILSQDGQYLDESVLRASDLWKTLLKRLNPEVRLVSDPFARSLLRQILDKHEQDLGVNSSAEETIFSYIDQLATILFHPEGPARLDEWFAEHEESKNRWRDWYLRARFCALKLVEEHHVITADWITAHLQNFNDLERVWQTPLIVDLGGEINRVEAELLRILSRSVDVIILEPSPGWKKEFSFLLHPYADLRSQAHEIRTLDSSVGITKKIHVLRFSGMLAEIKNGVGKARQWLDQGVSPEEISLVAPDIEKYWPVLHSFLQEEGIPCQKDVTYKLQSLPSVTRWLATLRSLSGRLSSSDLEISFFDREESESVRYEEFRALFGSLYASEDLNRHALVEKVFRHQLDLSRYLSRDEFVAQVLLYWRSENQETVQVILRELLQNASAATSFLWKEWLSYLESIVAQKEFLVIKGVPDGVMAVKLMSAHSDKSRYRIFLGLTDESLKLRSRTQISGQDLFDLAKDVGFYLDNPEQSDLEFELRLLSEAESIEDYYCFGATDLSGSLCSPSTFWMSQSGDHDSLSVPLETRWDELQSSEEKGIRPWIKARREFVEDRILQDLGKKEFSKLELKSLPRISASSIENFLECPFIFAAQRYYKLKDLPNIDLDIDHRTRGQLAHALFEKLTLEPMRFDWTREDLDRLLEEIKTEKKLIFADIRLWAPLKNKHVQLGLRFLDFEKRWRSEFKKTLTVAREKRFEFYLDPQTEEISTAARDNCFRISGQIDRVDSDGDHLVVIDYKSSAGGISAHGSWLKKHELQLLFYMWVLEKGLCADLGGEVIGLFYYIFKTFERKGFRIEDLAGTLYPAPKRKDKNANLETKARYLEELSALVMATLDRIKQGECQAQPLDYSTCGTCEWRRQCRAPHLN